MTRGATTGLLILFAALAMTLPLTACSQAKKTVEWKEQVKLANGQTIVVRRSQDYLYGYAGGGRPGWLFDYERMRATFASSGAEIAWQGRLTPLALDIAPNGDVYLVAVVATVAGRKEYRVPDDTNHLAFKQEANNPWQRVPITEVPREFRPNMMADTYGLFIEKASTADFVDLALKASVDSDPRIARRYRDWPRK